MQIDIDGARWRAREFAKEEARRQFPIGPESARMARENDIFHEQFYQMINTPVFVKEDPQVVLLTEIRDILKSINEKMSVGE